MSEMSVKMTLSLSDLATAPLTQFIDKLKSMDATLKGSTENLSAIGKMFGTLKVSKATVQNMNEFATSIKRAAETAPLVKSLSSELMALGASLAFVTTNSKGIGQALTSIGSRAGGASIQTAKLQESMAALEGVLSAAQAKLTSTAASFNELNGAARSAAAGVVAGTKGIGAAGEEVAATTAKVDGLAASFKAMAGLWAAFKIKKGLTASVDTATQYQQEEARLHMLNMPKGQAENISNQAWADSEKFKYASPLDALNIRKATMDALAEQQNQDLINQTTDAAIKATNVLANLGVEGDKKDITRQLLSISEMRGQTGDINAIKRNMDLVIKANLATGGKVTPADLDMFLRNFGSGSMTMSDDALLSFVGAIDQAKISGGSSGGGGNGASRMATAYKMLQAYMMGKPMNKQGAEILQETGIFGENAIIPGSTTTQANIRKGAAKDTALAASDIPAFIQKYMPNIMAYTERHAAEFYPGKSLSSLTTEDRDAALQKYIIALGVSVTAAQALVTTLNARSRERIEKQKEIAKRADGADGAQTKLDDTQVQKLAEFSAQLDKLKIALGQSVLPQLTKLIEKINELLDTVSKFAKDHQFVAALATWGGAILGITVGIRALSVLTGIKFFSIAKSAIKAGADITGASGVFKDAFRWIGEGASSMKTVITEAFSGAVDGVGSAITLMLSKVSAFLANPLVLSALRVGSGLAMLFHSEGLNQGEDAKMAAMAAQWKRDHGKPGTSAGHGASGSWGDPVTPPHAPSYPKANPALLGSPVSHAPKHRAARHSRESKPLNVIGDDISRAQSQAREEYAHLESLARDVEGINREYMRLTGGSDVASVIADTQRAGDKKSKELRDSGYAGAAQKNDDLTKLKIAHLQYADAMEKVKAIEDQLTESEKALGYAIKAGTITATEAANKQIELRRQAAAQMIPLLDKASQYATNPNDKALSEDKIAAAQSDLIALNSTALEVKNNMQNSFQGFFNGLLTNTKTLRQSFADLFKSIADNFAQMVARMIAEKMTNAIFGAGSNGGSQNGGWMASAIGSIFGGGSGGSGSSGIASWLGNLVGGSFATGTDYVPHDMLAIIHKGERITPAAYNNPKMSGGGGVVQHMNFNFDSPQSSQTMMQIAAASGQAIQRAMARNL